MNIKYSFSISNINDKLIQKKIVTVQLSYDQLVDLLYERFRKFKTYCSETINATNIDKYVISPVCENFLADTSSDIRYHYFVYISIENNIANITVTNDKYSYIYAFKQVVINDRYAGNCVTDFINRGIQPIIAEISKYSEDIGSRHENRIQESDYGGSYLYTEDFTQILKIKNLVTKMLTLCNKELQNLTDNYLNSF